MSKDEQTKIQTIREKRYEATNELERVQSINEAKLEIIKQVRDFLDAIVKATDNFNK